MSDFFRPKLQAVEALAPYRLRTSWSTGEVLEVDIQSVLSSVPALANLLDPKIFAKAHLAEWGHSVEWFDAELGADNVYAWAKEQAGEVSHQMFDTWMHRNGLSLNTAADALGISRRMVSYYRTAQKAIPRAIWLACLGWEITRPKTKTLPHALPTAKEYASAHQGLFMRTTLSIDDDVLFAAKRIALREGRSLGEVVSDLVRRSLQAPVQGEAEMTPLDAQLAALGLTPYRAPGVAVVTQAQIEALRVDEGV